MPPWLVANFYINFNKLILPFGKYSYKYVTKYQIKGNRLLLSGMVLHTSKVKEAHKKARGITKSE
jgi:hypothetical protein